MWGGVAHILDACGPSFESWGAWKMPAPLMHFLEECTVCTAQQRWEKMAAAMGGPLLLAVWH